MAHILLYHILAESTTCVFQPGATVILSAEVWWKNLIFKLIFTTHWPIRAQIKDFVTQQSQTNCATIVIHHYILIFSANNKRTVISKWKHNKLRRRYSSYHLFSEERCFLSSGRKINFYGPYRGREILNVRPRPQNTFRILCPLYGPRNTHFAASEQKNYIYYHGRNL